MTRHSLIGSSMTFSSRLAPQHSFPAELGSLTSDALEILNSRIHRQLDFEYQHEGDSHPETRFRLEFLTEELDLRENAGTGSVKPASQAQYA